MKNKLTIAAIICLIVAGACLIGVLYYAQGMSFSGSETSSATTSPISATQPATAVPLSVTTTGAAATPTENTAPSTDAPALASAKVSADGTTASAGRYIKVLNGITYEVVTTPATQEQGLSDRTSVPDNYAMLFDFPKDGTYGFWMKDMLVPLDMIWVTDSGTIAAIDSDVLPSTYPGVLYPPIPIRYVLETRAGFAQEKGWHVGTTLALPV